jgi:hypothetical protein
MQAHFKRVSAIFKDSKNFTDVLGLFTDFEGRETYYVLIT